MSVIITYGEHSFEIEKDSVTITDERCTWDEGFVRVPADALVKAAVEWQRHYGEKFAPYSGPGGEQRLEKGHRLDELVGEGI